MNEPQNNFLLSPPAQALKPSDALRLRDDEAYERFKAIRWGLDGRTAPLPEMRLWTWCEKCTPVVKIETAALRHAHQ